MSHEAKNGGGGIYRVFNICGSTRLVRPIKSVCDAKDHMHTEHDETISLVCISVPATSCLRIGPAMVMLLRRDAATLWVVDM